MYNLAGSEANLGMVFLNADMLTTSLPEGYKI